MYDTRQQIHLVFDEVMAPSAIAVLEKTQSITSINQILEKTAYLENNGAIAPKGLIGSALRKKVESIDHEACQPGEEDSFFVADLGEVYRQHMRWKLNLPRVKPFYGMFTWNRTSPDSTNATKPSSVTQMHESCAFSLNSVLDSIAPQRQRSNKS
jgi:hypothetical protein